MNIDTETRVEEFKTNLEADLASVESEITSLESNLNRLGQERNKLRRLIEEADKWLSSISDGDGHPQTAVVVSPNAEYGESPASLQEDSTTTNGLPENRSRREVVLEIVPSFQGQPFTAGDIRHRFVQDYLGEEPPYFPQAINNLLKRMAEKGEIKSLGREGDKPRDPYFYQEHESQEEPLSLRS